MEIMDVFNELIVLLTGLLGLIGTGISTYIAFKNWQATQKEKTKAERWNLVMSIADIAMKEAERSLSSGAEKKELALNIIKASANSAGLDLDPFMNQLDDYIDQTIKFVNEMNEVSK